MALFFCLLCLTYLCCLLLLLWSKSSREDPRLPPKLPGGLPLIGHAHLFIGGPLFLWKSITKIARTVNENGGVMRISLGPVTYNLVSDLEDCILVSNTCLTKDPAYDIAKQVIDNGLVTASVDVWRRHRKLLLPAYNQQVLDRYMPAFNEHSRILVDRLAQEVGKGPFDQNRYLQRTALEVSLQTTMGIQEFNESTDKFLDSVSTFLECLVLYKFLCVMNDYIFKLFSFSKKIHEAKNVIHNTADTIIKKKSNELKNDPTLFYTSTKCKSVLDILLEDGTLTDLEIRDEILTTVIASYDTVAISITFGLMLIAKHPEVQEKIYEELNNIFEGSDRDLDKEDLIKLKYMDVVLKETLRLYSPVPIVSRHVHEDIKLKNYTLPAGTNCVLSLYGIQHSAVWGPDAEEFRPERWFEKDVPLSALTAFSIGKRSCIGQKYGMMLMKTIFCHILRNYRLYMEGNKAEIGFRVLLKPSTGHEIRIERRNTSR